MLKLVSTALMTTSLLASSARADWKPAAVPISSPWAEKVDPKSPWPEYPRPQLVRENWTNLNGLWDYAITARRLEKFEKADGQILVPFCVESSLSGVGKRVGAEHDLWYRRTFAAPAKSIPGDRVLLHFGAVDWQATVFVNGQKIAVHEGGYEPFTLDVTSALKDGDNELTVRVFDPTDADVQPRGKQVAHPESIWYTPVTGIWQTVWLEVVPAVSIERLKLTPDVDAKSIRIETILSGSVSPADVHATVTLNGKPVGNGRGKSNEPLVIQIEDPKLWSPDSPTLYDVKVRLGESDVVTSYFGLRKVSMGKDAAGFNRLFINNEPLFLFGPLDQGWWPDGLYTAPTDEALKFDVEQTKKFGFNMCRKHIKVEPARWYYWCDKLGLAVWQDMPSGGDSSHIGDFYIKPDAKEDAKFTPIVADIYARELKGMIDALYNAPSIVAWVPFNEGWAQHNTNDVLKWTKAYDPSRLVDGPSGWEDRGFGDLHDMHKYPGPGMFPTSDDRISVLGEFGGLGLPLADHTWLEKGNWGYKSFANQDELNTAYLGLLKELEAFAAKGLAAAVYTQTTDVEIEVNGLMTYDRKVEKLDAARAHAAAKKVYDAAHLKK